ncbi:transposase [Virgibacillus flavescens]|uniref:transposase n=1 Tax=Virgibacillus flavescens TaxID=1611422 RepID=UPI003D346671
MPRNARRKSRSGMYHIMVRGVNKQTIFEDDEDRLRLLELIQKYKAISQFNLYSYCLMSNHVHLLIKESDESVSKTMQRINGSYVSWFNKKYERSGHLFQDRFRSENVETAPSFLKVLRYIHQNPVKAGLSHSVLDCKWTSINEYVSRANLVDIDLALNMFGSDKKVAIPLFAEYMQTITDDQFLEDYHKNYLTDSEIISHLVCLGLSNSSALQQCQKDRRDAIILELKTLTGVSARQLSRITGISKSVIDRIR